MKRTAAAITLLAGIGGCVSPGTDKATGKKFNQAYKPTEVSGVKGPLGEPVVAMKGGKKADSGVVQASGTMTDGGVQQAAGFARVIGSGCATGDCGDGGRPGLGHRLHGGGHGGHDPYAFGPSGSGLGQYLGLGGILPPSGMGPPGAVAAIGAIGPGMAMGPVATNQRTSIKFVNPQGTKVTWLGPNGYIEPGLTAPAAYNFMQGNAYRLRLTGVPGRPGKTYYPTLEVYPANLKTLPYLAHNTVPVSFTDDDFERVNGGSFVVKVIYLPDPAFQDIAAVAGPEELVSTQLEPGADPIAEATRRGTILAVIRVGNIDLENPYSPAMDAVPGGMPASKSGPAMPGMLMPGGTAMPPGGNMIPPAALPTAPAALPPAVRGSTTSMIK